LLLLLLTPKKVETKQINPERVNISKDSFLYLVFFFLFNLAILKIIPLWVGVIPILYAVIFDRKILLKVDYFLLLTFFLFFGITNTLTEVWNFHLSNPLNVFLISAFGSLVISNVPAALLLAKFTHNWEALLWGVNVGGFGSLIGSMANLIAYRFYVQEIQIGEKVISVVPLIGDSFLPIGGCFVFDFIRVLILRKPPDRVPALRPPAGPFGGLNPPYGLLKFPIPFWLGVCFEKPRR
jgi:hypothetical protein